MPRLLNRVYANITNELKQKSALAVCLFDSAFNGVKTNYLQTGNVEHGCMENIIFKNIKKALGGNIKLIVTGSAPIKEEVLDFLKITIGVNIGEG